MANSARGRTINTKIMGSVNAPVSAETQNLLKLMMEESKLTNFQRRQLNSRLNEGRALPLSCNPTSSKDRNNKPAVKSPPPKKVLNGKSLSISGKRPKEVIDTMVESNAEIYRPVPGKLISEKDKRKLQNKMTYGDDAPDIETPRVKARPKVQDLDDSAQEIDEFDEVLNDIEERRQFLKEMEDLGQGKQYRPIIQTEISQKIRELELIDKQRTVQLEKLLDKDD